jgi:pyruvate dehydrogenase E2 component (dihydrolipoamide acetyltransferase)
MTMSDLTQPGAPSEPALGADASTDTPHTSLLAGVAVPGASTSAAIAGDAPISTSIPSDAGDGAQPPSATSTAKGETTEVQLSRGQHNFARRAAESKATVPHLTLQIEVDMQECVALGASSASPDTSSAASPPICTDMVLRACALALREHPRANSSYRDGRVLVHSRVNIGFAVSLDSSVPADPVGGGASVSVIVPTLFDADALMLAQTAQRTRELSARAREGSLEPPELSGATFTVFDLGRFGIDAFTATVPPSQAAILALGSIRPRPVVGEDGQILARHTAILTLSCDHRVLYGADAAGLLAGIRDLLLAPGAL